VSYVTEFLRCLTLRSFLGVLRYGVSFKIFEKMKQYRGHPPPPPPFPTSPCHEGGFEAGPDGRDWTEQDVSI
jgi:hypothetical protein